jgi:hypothetical protein
MEFHRLSGHSMMAGSVLPVLGACSSAAERPGASAAAAAGMCRWRCWSGTFAAGNQRALAGRGLRRPHGRLGASSVFLYLTRQRLPSLCHCCSVWSCCSPRQPPVRGATHPLLQAHRRQHAGRDQPFTREHWPAAERLKAQGPGGLNALPGNRTISARISGQPNSGAAAALTENKYP